MAFEVEQEEKPPPKDKWPWAQHEGKFSIPFISSVTLHLNFQ
jgi:hypothetical protein